MYKLIILLILCSTSVFGQSNTYTKKAIDDKDQGIIAYVNSITGLIGVKLNTSTFNSFVLTAVTKNGAETLTNKVLTSPVLTTPSFSGTVVGPLSIAGNLEVNSGSGTNTITLRDGTITKPSGNAFVFSTGINAGSTISGNRFFINNGINESGNGGTTGLKWGSTAFTANDPVTAQNGTAPFSSNFSLGQYTLTATNTGITTTTAANLYIAGDPIAGTNQTITNSYGLYNVGKSFFNGAVNIPNRLTTFGAINNSGLIGFIRATDGTVPVVVGYGTSTESNKFSINNQGGTGSLSFGTGGVADRVIIGADGITTFSGQAIFSGGAAFNNGTAIFGGTIIAPVIRGSNGIEFRSNDNATTLVRLHSTGNMSIGSTTDDTNKLSVNGDINLSGTNSKIKYGNVNFLHTPGTGNTFVGIAAGNTTLTGSANHGFGPGALNNLTTGSQNIGIGTSAGGFNANGANNVFIGHGSGLNATTTSSSNNVFIGWNAGRNQTATGSNVIALGADVLAGAGNLSDVFVTPTTTRHLIGTYDGSGTDILKVVGNSSFTGNINTVGAVSGYGISASGNRSKNVIGDGPTGVQASFLAYSNNDPATAVGTTTPLVVSHGIGIPTFTATNTGQVYTNLINHYIAGPPVPSTNVTATNLYSLYVASGTSAFGGNIVPLSDGAGALGVNGKAWSTARIGTVLTDAIQDRTSSGIFFKANGGINIGKFDPATGNLLLQNGGTFTDNGRKFQVTGDESLSGKLYGVTATLTSSASTAAGSGATVSVVGDDKAGTITIVLGSSPTAGKLATVTFSSAYLTNIPTVVISTSGGSTIPVGTIDETLTGFAVNTGATPVSGTIKINYIVMGRL